VEVVLFINMEVRRGILFIRLCGFLNKKTSEILKAKITSLINLGIKYYVLNLEKLNSIDEEGCKTLKDNYEQIIKANGNLVLCGISQSMIERFDCNETLFNIFKVNYESNAFRLLKL